MYERIMVPLDGSKLAEVSLPCVEEISGRFGSEVIVVGACEAATSKYRHVHQCYLSSVSEDIARRIKEHYGVAEGEVKVRPVMLAEHPEEEIIGLASSVKLLGHPAAEIIDYADKHHVGLIVMATHGYSGVKRWTLGSVADTIVRGSSKPVLLIRAEDGQPAVREKEMCTKMVVPLDGSKLAEAALTCIEEVRSRLAPELKVEVCLLHVIPLSTHIAGGHSGESYLDYLCDERKDGEMAKDYLDKARAYLDKTGQRLKDKGVVVRSEVRVGKAAEEIIKFANEINSGVVVMSTHGRSGFNRLVLGSIADRVLRLANIPVMLIRPSEAVGRS